MGFTLKVCGVAVLLVAVDSCSMFAHIVQDEWNYRQFTRWVNLTGTNHNKTQTGCMIPGIYYTSTDGKYHSIHIMS